ncbi:MAG: acyl--CoA ligase [Oscillospiraceae bacterium]|nr:acyl--CoA ligase [Oscillospiraceae bacterium]
MVSGERTFLEYLREYAEASHRKPLLGCPQGWLTAEQVLALVETTAWHLRRQGIGSGDLVALRTTRSRESVLIILALQALGAVAVLTEPHTDASGFLESCGVKIPVRAIVSNDPAVHPVWDGRGLTLTKTGTDTEIPMDPFALEPHGFREEALDPKAPGFVIFTSGSTGDRKAVVLNQYALAANLLDAHPLGGYLEEDIALGVLPLDHVFGLVLMAGICVLGYRLYLPEQIDVPTILSAIEKERITRMNGVPSLYLAMARQKAGYDLSSLHAGFIGGGPCTPEAFREIETALDMTLVSAYGMSECVGITSSSWRDPLEKRSTTVGRFYPRNRGKILLEDGTEAPTGVEGEICVDGHARMLGYYGGAASQQDLLHTGDMGYLDAEGYVHISGRKKDIIIRNGVNLSPRRIENALLSLPQVSQAAVVGLPDPQCGELPYAMVVASGCTEEELLAQLQPLLTRNEMPAGVYFTDSLPLTPSGKLHKYQIREVLQSWKNL